MGLCVCVYVSAQTRFLNVYSCQNRYSILYRCEISTQVHDAGTSADEDRTQVAQEPDSMEPGGDMEQPETLLDEERKSAHRVNRDCRPKQGECQKRLQGVSASDLPVLSADTAVPKPTEEAMVSEKRCGKWADRLHKKPKKHSPEDV